MPNQPPESFLPLTFAVYHILVALSDQERHGYGIILEVERLTEGNLRMAPGTLYGAINRLSKDGLLEESKQRPDPTLDDSRRKYYRLTALGRAVAIAEAQRLQMLVDIAYRKSLLPTQS